jgi:6-pyruvoyltetrahydropterin/6-carboxytetrahydropterin synthase
MMYRIGKQFHFSASHQLEGLPDGHPCGRLHGHNDQVELILTAELLDDTGFVVDYGDLRPFQQLIDQELDHRHLNDVLPFQTSAENIARYLYGRANIVAASLRSPHQRDAQDLGRILGGVVTSYVVNDIYTCIQGEGVQTGVAMVLLRLQGCAVGCPWCDTKETSGTMSV